MRITGPTGNEINKNSAIVERKITKFHVCILADLIHSRTGYGVISHFRSGFIEVRIYERKCRLDVLGRIGRGVLIVCPPIGGLLVILVITVENPA